jgi:hypothetical protein
MFNLRLSFNLLLSFNLSRWNALSARGRVALGLLDLVRQVMSIIRDNAPLAKELKLFRIILLVVHVVKAKEGWGPSGLVLLCLKTSILNLLVLCVMEIVLCFVLGVKVISVNVLIVMD